MKKNSLVTVLGAVIALIVIALVAVNFAPKSSQDNSPTAAGDLVEGTHYRLLKEPLSTGVNGVSVIEFFWYGCPHCRAFEPRIKEWLSKAPDDVDFKLVPVVWNDATRLHAAMFYTGLEAERADELHASLFDLIIDNRQEKNLDRQIAIAGDLFQQHGVSASTLADSLTQSAIQTQVSQAQKDMRTAEVSSTPSLVIGGKYLILNNEAVAEKGLFTVVDTLVDLVRQQS